MCCTLMERPFRDPIGIGHVAFPHGIEVQVRYVNDVMTIMQAPRSISIFSM